MTQTIYNKLISKINISKRYKNKIAIIYENKKISFNKLVANIDNLAQNLKKEKKKLNKPILVALENTDNYIYLLFAASKLNISLLLVTPDITIEEIKKVKKKTNIMIFDKKNISKIKREINGTVKLIAVEKLLTKNIHPFKKIEKLKKNKFIINFSSGSTGKPKEIIYSQNLKIERSKQLQQNFNVTERDIFINYAPIYHSLGQRLTFSSLLHLNTIILMKKFNFAEWENNINRYKATILFPISSHLSLLVKSLNKNFKKYKSVKKIIASSSQISRKTKQIITKKYNRLFFETYGAAEIAFASILTPDDPKSKKNSVGKPPKDVIIKILKKKGNKYGEICCKTKFLSSFTFKEKKNKKIFFKESFFKTGDVGYLDNDNYLYFISRLKDIIIKSGVNIVPKKIEDVILSDNLIKNCAVIGVKDEIFGETPLAICELKKKNDKNINIFENNLRKKLSRTLFPSEIVYTDTIKFLPSGKINKVFYKEKYKRFIFNKGKSELFV